MSHHSSDHPAYGSQDDPVKKQLTEEMLKVFGEYPQGRLNPQDAGALPLAIGMENGKVVMRFPKPVVWIGFTPEDAIGIAQLLIQNARAAGVSMPVTIKIG